MIPNYGQFWPFDLGMEVEADGDALAHDDLALFAFILISSCTKVDTPL